VLLALAVIASVAGAAARTVETELVIAEELVAPAGGRKVLGLTVNGGIPGPTLRFREGDIARIHVHNRMSRESTSVHWHGLLVPNDQDGVPDLTTPRIQPGTTFTYEFPIRQSGTYWYHSHTGLQEQRGIYGSIVITPREGETVAAERDHVVLLSDWTRERPEEVLRTLKSGSDWYALRKGAAQSVSGAWGARKLGAYFRREFSRMPAMDISDVAYDAFLANGAPRTELAASPGERVRLRLINGSSSTYFYIQSATGPMTVVAADGQDVEPFAIDRLLIAVAETYHVVVRLPAAGAWEVRATAQDASGHSSTILGSGELHRAPDVPRPDLYDMDGMMMASLDAMDGAPPAAAEAPATTQGERPFSPYPQLRAPRSSVLPRANPTRSITLRLTGDMERYVWSFNGKTLSEESTIPVRKGENLRIELVNDTMMHHPIHLHGHFFRLTNGQGDRAPLKHTVDVLPMGRRTIEFEANEVGDWFFHCHFLYHMESGMHRVVTYVDQGEGHTLNLGMHAHDQWFLFGVGTIESQMSEGRISLTNSRNDLVGRWEAGWGGLDTTDYEADLLYGRYFNPNLSLFAGLRLTNEAGSEDRALAGVAYRLPFLIHSELSLDSEGDARLMLAKELQLTSRLAAFATGEYDTGSQWQWSGGVEFTLGKRTALISRYHSDYGFGAGMSLRY